MSEVANSPSVTIKIRLPGDLADTLHEVAAGRGIGLSTLIRMFCYACLEKSA